MTEQAPEVRAAPKDSNGDTDLSRCTREQLIELIRECQRALLDANENLMVRAAEPVTFTEAGIDEYVDGYVMEHDDAFYTPNDHERFFIKDAIMGLIGTEHEQQFNQSATAPSVPAPAYRLRYEYVQGETFEEMRRNVRESELFKIGDAVCVWANEGDLCMVGDRMPVPQPPKETP
jgi:hypothetical protein